ncbi:DUF4870 family protein [Halotalea alkalilenta]|uniref:Transmembrane protein n=1 Tax=Halotalea alkalilenta TaxID=376489 RepID=A0A172YIB6_9GAMM|nr:hypothetical protein [Halotalea alkalilenta]ANF58964.1 hypothetical protein A5892_17070 [Halotalea alkalilenta]
MTTTEPIATTLDDDNPAMARIIYILYLVSLATGITALVGLVMAYVYGGRASPWITAHYRFQIRTFWIGLGYFIIATLLSLIGVGLLLFPLVYLWIIIRCARGWRDLENRSAPGQPDIWLY